ncbi:uroporphyrinogen decarboxylase [Candidatus Viridilinea mediisalina]|uniref:Uroporphyrinogen decarboxylase n=1 Tax=Candidatus Viridilinea mediisalina TaxID=2024553 RepID=A0A2A6RJA2_9CHLR|nr:uroporphyrinogen decarboxylase [Candidatus Viridilinea mediisalina]PDW02969.1 uroporphyrinogen decarboxylase [Candidatus Viridilinea mediisalina]
MTKPILAACRREPTDHTPIWLMRQAGRYMSVYREVRERHGFLQMVKIPEVAAEVTLQPITAFGMDAAIIFADILPPLEGLGIHLTFEKGEGPVIHNPIRTPADIEALKPYDAETHSGYTLEALQIVRRELPETTALYGFSGAPFTLASYAIEGGGSREYRRTKAMMYNDPANWHKLMDRLTDMVINYLEAQVAVGCDVVQIFDSWAGSLAPDDFREYVLPYVQRAVRTTQERTKAPVVYFGTDMNGMLPMLRETGADVLGLDWRVRLEDGWAQYGHDVAIQGNLDPMALHGSWPEIERRAKMILDQAAGRPGHIFNVGHGILTETPEDNVRRLVEFVQNYRYQG